jgi:hypothetical protein
MLSILSSVAKLARLGHIGPAGPPNDFQIIKWAPDPMKHGYIFIVCVLCACVLCVFLFLDTTACLCVPCRFLFQYKIIIIIIIKKRGKVYIFIVRVEILYPLILYCRQ